MAGRPAVLKVDIISDFKADGLSKADASLGDLAKKAAIAGAALAAALGAGALSAVRAAEEAQRASERLANVLQQTAGASGEVIAAVEDQASALSRLTGVDDEVIKGGQAILGTFKSVAQSAGATGGVFDRATTAAADLAAAGFGTIESASTQLGKALEDPIKGITALTRSGVTFTEAEREKIRALTESGDLLGAQNMILAAVEGQVGGTAAASATASDKMKVAFGEVQEAVGAALLPAFERLAGFVTGTLGPALEGFVAFVRSGDLTGLAEAFDISPDSGFLRFLQGARDALGGTIGFLQRYSGYLIPLAAAVGAVAVALKLWSTALAVQQAITKAAIAVQLVYNAVLAANPIGLVVLALVALVTALVVAYKRSETFRNVVQGAFDAIKTAIGAVVDFFKAVWNVAFAVVKAYFETYRAVVLAVFGAIRSAVQAAAGFFRAVFSGIAEVLSAPFLRAKDIILGAWNFLKGAITNIGDGLKRTANSVIDVINRAIRLANRIPGISIPEIGGLSAAAGFGAVPSMFTSAAAGSGGTGGGTVVAPAVRVYVDDHRLRDIIRVEIDGIVTPSPRVLSGARA